LADEGDTTFTHAANSLTADRRGFMVILLNVMNHRWRWVVRTEPAPSDAVLVTVELSSGGTPAVRGPSAHLPGDGPRVPALLEPPRLHPRQGNDMVDLRRLHRGDPSGAWGRWIRQADSIMALGELGGDPGKDRAMTGSDPYAASSSPSSPSTPDVTDLLVAPWCDCGARIAVQVPPVRAPA
jgi:hypothetical protein